MREYESWAIGRIWQTSAICHLPKRRCQKGWGQEEGKFQGGTHFSGKCKHFLSSLVDTASISINNIPSVAIGIFGGKIQNVLDQFREALNKETNCSVQSLGYVRLFATSWTAAHQASLSITNSQSLLKLMSIESVMPSNHLILCGPLLLQPSIFPSIRVFSNESVLHSRRP